MADLVKTTIFYSNVEDFSSLNAVYARHMPDPPPARSAPANVTLPRGLLVSIDAIAVLPDDVADLSEQPNTVPRGALRVSRRHFAAVRTKAKCQKRPRSGTAPVARAVTDPLRER